MMGFEDIMRDFESNIEKNVRDVTEWLKKSVISAGAKGVVLGMSGGVDCSTVACLAEKAGIPILLVKMPYGKSMDFAGDRTDADELIEKFKFSNTTIDITKQVDEQVKFIEKAKISNGEIASIELRGIAKANIMPRVRMTTLYSIGQSLGYLVIGTGNLSEITMGYCTKWGDAACDLNPLAMFTKTEVRIMARYLGVPDRIVSKSPSANLWEGQTDEEEMGITYYDLDKYIVTGEGNNQVKEKIEAAKEKNAHKFKKINVYER